MLFFSGRNYANTLNKVIRRAYGRAFSTLRHRNIGEIIIDVINIKVAEANTRSEKIEAVRQASLSRLQPIVLTTITTVAGLSPLVITDPTWAPLAVSIIFGLIFATILTLIVVPILYVRFARQIRNNN